MPNTRFSDRPNIATLPQTAIIPCTVAGVDRHVTKADLLSDLIDPTENQHPATKVWVEGQIAAGVLAPNVVKVSKNGASESLTIADLGTASEFQTVLYVNLSPTVDQTLAFPVDDLREDGQVIVLNKRTSASVALTLTTASGVIDNPLTGAGASSVTVPARTDKYILAYRYGNGEWHLVDSSLKIEVTPTGGDDTAQILAAAVAAGNAGGVVWFRPGTYDMTSSVIGTNEGPAIELTAAFSNIIFRGTPGVTILKPASNKVEMFWQNGAVNVSFEDLIFDNSDNGQLQNQVKPGSLTPGGGVAGQGNSANCAIRESDGGGLTVKRCEFISFLMACDYIGDSSDDQVLLGDLTVDSCIWRDCGFGVLAAQPERIFFLGKNQDFDTGVSTNFDASTDPGHMLYVTNRTGAAPKIVSIDQAYSEDGYQSGLKVRKGDIVTFNQIHSYNCGRGPEFWGARRVVGGDIVTVLGATASTNNSGLEITDLGYSRISNVWIDVNGQDAWGVRVRSDTSTETWANNNNHLSGVTVVNDYSGATGKAPIAITDQTGFELKDFEFIHPGTISGGKRPIDMYGCIGARIINPSHRSFGAADEQRLVTLDGACEDCYIEWSHTGIDALPDGNTISDSGTNTIISTASTASVHNGDSGAADTVSWWLGHVQSSTLTANTTLTFNGPQIVDGLPLILRVTQDSTPRTITWPGAVKWTGGTPPTLSTGSADEDVFGFVWDGTTYHGYIVTQE